MSRERYAALEAICRRDPGGRGLPATAPWGPIETVARELATVERLAIVTGFPHLATDRPETDGPLGAVALGRAMTRLGRGVCFPTDARTAPVLAALGAPGVEVLGWPVEAAARRVAACDWRARHGIDGLLAIERPGRVADGTYRNFRGVDISEAVAPLDELFLSGPGAADHGAVRTFAIGDGGNEVGMGNLVDPRMRPVGAVEPRDERPPGSGGISGLPPWPSVVTVHRLVVAGTSNWGAYALLAALSRVTGQDLLPGAGELEDDLGKALAAGAVDGITGRAEPTVDGLPYRDTLALVAELRAMG